MKPSGNSLPASAAALAFVLTLVSVHGRVTDDTTGQPLAGVAIDVYAGDSAKGPRLLHTATGGDGRFLLRGLHRGTYSLALSSDDVPRAEETIRIDSAHPPELSLHACSTTLDYSCRPKFEVPKEGANSNG